MFSWVDKVTKGAQSLKSFIRNVGFWLLVVPATTIQFLDCFNWRLISELIKGISSVLLKLLRYLNGTTISGSFVPPFPVCPVFFFV